MTQNEEPRGSRVERTPMMGTPSNMNEQMGPRRHKTMRTPRPGSEVTVPSGHNMRSGVQTRTRTDVSRLRGAKTSPQRYHAGVYKAPSGYHYQRWSPGERLPHIYFVRTFWILDFIDFGLFLPPPGYVWVRFGPDALLIDTFTGEVIAVEYDVFW
ncbi:MAG: RcnB family protein [Proteobacteria bacterium]|nr:RcnB family protein [Pseudomonadota bacterium]